jgi:hypothetical protein
MKRHVFDWVEHVTGNYSRKADLWTYTHFRLFHGCRPIDVLSYYVKGILVMPLDELAREFRQIFADYGSEALGQAISKITRCDDEWRVDTALDLRFLIKHASHYILQGSETLKAFAANLPWTEGKDPRERLKNVGIPTALVIEAPLSAIDDQTLQEMDDTLDLLVTGGTHEACDDGDLIDFTVSFSKGIPREWIVGHEIITEATALADRGRQYRCP